MKKHSTISPPLLAATVSATLLLCHCAFAATAEEAARLKTDLTPLGAERAGNKDGSIPAWEGGYTKVPAGYTSGQPRPDPFAAEKPLLTITASNMAQHLGRLDEGQQHLLKSVPGYKLNVYPTHRTAAAPDWVYQETLKNATRAKLDGFGVKGAYGGVPFPIPKSGAEVMWNHLLRVRPSSFTYSFTTYLVDTAGKSTVASTNYAPSQTPYYTPGSSPEQIGGGAYYAAAATATEPPVRVGESTLVQDRLDGTRQAWQYLVGQRRVRRAPLFCCDTPNAVASGVEFIDQVYVFFGPLDAYDWKILGKKEMYIPYNMNGFMLKPASTVLTKGALNPDAMRWELHRVWEIEATLRPGQRDVRPRRKFYVDEDSWIAAIGNTWDAQGAIWHTTVGNLALLFDLPAVSIDSWATVDLTKGSYVTTLFNDAKRHVEIMSKPLPHTLFTPEGMLNQGVR